MDESKPIIVSNEYRSGYLLRVKKVNGKVSGLWLEVSDHHEHIADTLSSLNDIVDKLKLKDDVNIISPPPPKPLAETQPINVRYVCGKCNYSFPAFASSPANMSYYCPSCNRWMNFQKK